MEFNTTKRDSPQGNRDFAPIESAAMDGLVVPPPELLARTKTKGYLLSKSSCTNGTEINTEILSSLPIEQMTRDSDRASKQKPCAIVRFISMAFSLPRERHCF
jgi:hypothetical protein